MKLTVIGSQGAYPAAGRPTSGYLIQSDGFSMMLDFGSGILMKLHEYLEINNLDAVCLSHYHPDHVADIGVLQHAVKVQTDLGNKTKKLPIYGLPGKTFFDSLTYHSYTEGRVIDPDVSLAIGPFNCAFMINPHPDGGCSMRISDGSHSLVYTGDTGWNEKLIDFAANCDLLLCEASLFNQFKGRVSGHLTSGEAGVLARKADVGQLALCHFPHFGTTEVLKSEAEEEFRGILTLALSGNVYDLTVN